MSDLKLALEVTWKMIVLNGWPFICPILFIVLYFTLNLKGKGK